jgi:hypothetical protein
MGSMKTSRPLERLRQLVAIASRVIELAQIVHACYVIEQHAADITYDPR